MRTTLTISDELLVAAKRRAHEQGVTLGQFVDAALQRELTSEPVVSPPPIPVFDGGTGPSPGIDLTSNRSIYAALDEGVELDKLR